MNPLIHFSSSANAITDRKAIPAAASAYGHVRLALSPHVWGGRHSACHRIATIIDRSHPTLCKKYKTLAQSEGRIQHQNPPTFQEVADKVQKRHGLTLSLWTLGPLYKMTCLMDSGVLIGETDGFVVPFTGLLHCDTVRIYNSRFRGQVLTAKGNKASSDGMASIGAMGVGKLMACGLAAYGLSRGCHTAEILAIRDDDETHRKLVLYYRRLGFRPVKEVTGESLGDVPDMLVWGGVGTRMNADIREFLKKVSYKVR